MASTYGKIECELCGRLWSRATFRMQEGKTCSKLCSSIKGYLSGEHKETGIETKLRTICEELGYQFTTQKPLRGITVVDIFIEPNVVLFADGTYWHRRIEEKDRKVKEKLERDQFVVLRLTEKEIDGDREALVEKIKKGYAQRQADFKVI